MSQNEKIQIVEIVVVEGIHDKQAVLEIANADVWVIGGNRIARRFMEELRRASQSRGVVILTDPDGAGEQIRRRIEQAVPGCKHAFVPKREAVSDTGVGVEHASPQAIRAAFEQVRLTKQSTLREGHGPFNMEDLLNAGLANGRNAAQRRTAVGDVLRIGYANAKSFLHKLNALGVSRDEWQRALDIVGKEDEGKP
jgi:ribonuclease M5